MTRASAWKRNVVFNNLLIMFCQSRHMRRPLVLAFLLVSAAPVSAAEEAHGKPEAHAKESAHGKEGEKGGAPGTNIDMPFLMAPMTGADGKLSGYAYISSRLTATSDVTANQVRDKIAFVQDAFVRDVNAKEIATSGDPVTVDNAALQTRLLADARKVVGASKLVSIAITQVQIAPLHPTAVTAVAGQPPPVESAPPPPAKPAHGH